MTEDIMTHIERDLRPFWWFITGLSMGLIAAGFAVLLWGLSI